MIHQDTPDKYHVIQTLQTAQASRNLGLDPINHRVFVAAAKFGSPPAGGTGRGAMLPGSFSLMVIERDPAILQEYRASLDQMRRHLDIQFKRIAQLQLQNERPLWVRALRGDGDAGVLRV